MKRLYPDNSSGNLPNAGPIKRIGAILYDSLFVFVLLLAVTAIAFLLRYAITGELPVPNSPEAMDDKHSIELSAEHFNQLPAQGPLFQGALLISTIGFFILSWLRNGQTLGMKSWRLRVENLNGEAVSLLQAISRLLLAPISLGLFGFGYWWCWINKEGHALHDQLTKTRVVALPKE